VGTLMGWPTWGLIPIDRVLEDLRAGAFDS
jgi:hypothetical protein